MADDLDPRWHGVVVEAGDWHFLRRLYERYGFVLAPGDFSAIRRSVRDGTALLVKRRPGKPHIFAVTIPSTGKRAYVSASAGGRLHPAMPPMRKGLHAAYKARRAEIQAGAVPLTVSAAISGDGTAPESPALPSPTSDAYFRADRNQKVSKEPG